MKRTQELEKIHIVRAILIVLIVLYHSSLFWTGTWFKVPTMYKSSALSWLALWLNSFHIYCFTFVSGYLFYYLKREKGKYTNLIAFIKNKGFRLLLPYITVALFWNIPFSLCFGMSPKILVRNYILGLSPEQLWFLLMLFGVFILFYAMEKCFYCKNTNQGNNSLFACCFFSFFIGIGGWAFIPNFFQIWRVLMFVFFFYMGYITRNGRIYQYLRIDGLSLTGYFLIYLFLFILAHFLYISNYFMFKFTKLSIEYICHILGAFTMFHILLNLTKIFGKKLKIISDNAFGIYLFHQQIIYIWLYFMANKLNPYLTTFTAFIISLLLSLLITLTLSNISYTRKLIGLK